MALFSIQIEKHVLGGLMKNPHTIGDIDRFISSKDFVAEPHDIIYGCIRSSVLNSEKVDSVLIAQKIKNLGIAFKDEVNIFDYLEAISFSSITADATIKAAQELAKLSALREIEKTCDEMKDIVSKSANNDLTETISKVDSLYGEKMNSFEFENEPTLLFDDINELVEERGNNPVEELGIETPFPEFNRLYGGLRPKNLYVVAARAKAGKSTFINALASKISQTQKIPVLILDTEMSTEETQFRAAASKTGINPWYLETGNWRKNEEMVAKVRANLANIKNNYLVYHMAIGNKSIEEIKSIARRWFFKVVKRGNKGLICFDYIKMVDKLSKNQQEYQAMGDKVDTLKKLAEELNCPILSAVQTNRSGITTGRESSEMIEDESVVGISDRICWYASFVGLLRRKSPDEIALDTPESGNSLLKELVSRFQGRDAQGQADVIRRRLPDGKFIFTKNYINLQFSNFDVEERGSLRDSIARQNAQFLIEDGGVETREDDTL